MNRTGANVSPLQISNGIDGLTTHLGHGVEINKKPTTPNLF